jgi:hypothetical protein
MSLLLKTHRVSAFCVPMNNHVISSLGTSGLDEILYNFTISNAKMRSALEYIAS